MLIIGHSWHNGCFRCGVCSRNPKLMLPM
ncbi:hypothetical protein D3P09_03785 [Paenibacillus pinisoli]|uniref:Uncharacterized protein n=1 Tax=Paenibacillus pinisoli TaxID=1276110 RepID=A0A3A6PN50_9BACL|nr:hypothetical protein D3P09_03785 [Paenibacillus pinisoli]